MLQYLVIMLDRTAVSFCHYPAAGDGPALMPLPVLRDAIRYAMKENLNVQFVYPARALPDGYAELIDTVDHTDIRPVGTGRADVLVADGWDELAAHPLDSRAAYVLRTSGADFFTRHGQLREVLPQVARLSVVLTDVERFAEADLDAYRAALEAVGDDVEALYAAGHAPQLNLLTDRMMLDAMNNCGAGDTTLTLGPDGRFYVCPAFCAGGEAASVGSLADGPVVPNAQLYRLERAPLCRRCDAWQCRRCVWLNRKLTLEVNTPGREQCVTAHLERNASRRLLEAVRRHGEFLPGREIKEIKYLDPFDVRDEINLNQNNHETNHRTGDARGGARDTDAL